MAAPALGPLALRVLATWVLLSWLGLACAPELVAPLLPMFSAVLDMLLLGQFIPSLDLAGEGNGAVLRLSALTIRALPLPDDIYVPAMARLPHITTHLSHVLVPAILLACALVAWPARNRAEALLRVALGVVAMAPVMALTTPVTLAGRLHMLVSEPGPGNHRWLLDWVLFAEGGGRWLVPRVAAAACTTLAHRCVREGRGSIGRGGTELFH